MAKFKIITDSSANLTDEIINKYQIPILSLSFIVNDVAYKSYENGRVTELKMYYEMMREKEHVSTSCVNGDEAYTICNKILKDGEDILYIGFSSKLSNTYNVVRLELESLQKKYPDRKILYIDSLAASLGQGMIVATACQMRESGKTIDEIYIWVEKNKLKACHLFTVNTLYHLLKGGRVNKVSYLISNVLDIKPIMHVDMEGRLIAIGKTIGRKRSLNNLVDRLVDSILNPEEQTIYISHGDSLEDALYCKKRISERINVKDFVINYVDLVVGAHSGPGTIAIFYYGEHR
ncbi:DegV family protein [Acholeplasma sp. OttesenSCG-928-E16]|nr:DegV family protein [Acholeplasma sp. OttesenSCG-928-E16]